MSIVLIDIFLQSVILTLHMVDRNPRDTHNEGESPVFNEADAAEFQRRFTRIEQLSIANAMLSLSIEYDRSVSAAGGSSQLTKRFVSRSPGTGHYPFSHYRIKLREKNRTDTPVDVVAFRYPTIGPASTELNVDKDRLFIAWRRKDQSDGTKGETDALFLCADGLYNLKLDAAFHEAGIDGHWPTEAAKSPAGDRETALLETVFTDFEQDLQTHGADVEA